MSIIRQCREAGVQLWHKQMPLRDARGTWRVSRDPRQWPAEFSVRQLPTNEIPKVSTPAQPIC